MKLIFSIFIVFIFALSTAFFWKEKLNFSKRIDDEKIGNYFTAFGSVAAALSIFFLYRQLQEMQADRKSANLPDLYPAYTKFFMKQINNSSFIDGEDKPIVVTLKLENTDIAENKRAYIELHNIGLGAAKNITINWKYDREKVKEIFKNIYYCHDSKHNEMEHIDFIQAAGKINISIPQFYLTCCGSQLNQTYIDIVEPVNEKLKPDLKCEISYQNIYNNWQSKIFNVTV